MKKIALVAAPAALLFALSACGDAAEEPVAEDTAMVEETPIEEATDLATDAAAEATDAAAEATDAAAEAVDAAAEATAAAE